MESNANPYLTWNDYTLDGVVVASKSSMASYMSKSSDMYNIGFFVITSLHETTTCVDFDIEQGVFNISPQKKKVDYYVEFNLIGLRGNSFRILSNTDRFSRKFESIEHAKSFIEARMTGFYDPTTLHTDCPVYVYLPMKTEINHHVSQ